MFEHFRTTSICVGVLSPPPSNVCATTVGINCMNPLNDSLVCFLRVLSAASGVMMYVSFVEIFHKSLLAFEDWGLTTGMSNLMATLCFFGGIFFGKSLNALAHYVGGHAHDHHDSDLVLDTLEEDLARCAAGGAVGEGSAAKPETGETELVEMMEAAAGKGPAGAEQQVAANPSERDRKLEKMGMQTALAIGIHNFPEGLATFVAALDSPAVGFGMAAAIAIHNVPEGLCVSVPIYFATKDRWVAFYWALVSGISEPIGAALGWLLLYRIMDELAYGVVFGMVAGMMVNICVKELLPTAFKYDPRDRHVTSGFISGMAVMAVSLVLFVLV